MELWVRKGSRSSEFIIQEYLPGRNIAWDSLWKDGRLVTSYARERLEYPFKHISPSGITGTPSVARIVHDDKLNEVAQRAVKAIDPRPNGAYSIDVKESATGEMCVTEVDSGKFHSTMPLWGYIAVKHLKMPWYCEPRRPLREARPGRRSPTRSRAPTSSLKATICSGTWTSARSSGGRTAGRRRCSDAAGPGQRLHLRLRRDARHHPGGLGGGEGGPAEGHGLAGGVQARLPDHSATSLQENPKVQRRASRLSMSSRRRPPRGPPLRRLLRSAQALARRRGSPW